MFNKDILESQLETGKFNSYRNNKFRRLVHK